VNKNFFSQRSLKESSSRLLIISACFLFIFSVILTLSPAARYRNWDVDYRWGHWIGYFIWLASAIIIFFILKKHYKNWDIYIYFTAQILIGWGLLTIFRLNVFFGFRQTLWVFFSSTISIILLLNPFFINQIKKYKYFWLFSGLALIALTFFFGTYPGGTGPKLWLGFKGVFFQPSEILKIILIVYLASYFSEKQSGKFDIPNTILPTLILAAASVLLLIAQKDLGTALIFITIYFLMVYFVFGKKRILLIGAVLILLSTVIGYFFIDLIRIRFQGWILPWSGSQSSSYQIIQSIIAIASGGLFGTGFGLGNPNLVPLAHSDFIFSAIAEETGLIGSIGFIILLLIFLFRGMHLSLTTRNKFHRYLSAGITIYIITQSILIIGGNIRLLPITGVTLPFVSYGGSSLLTSYLALTTLLIMSGQNDQKDILVPQIQPYKTSIALLSICFIAISLTIGWWGFIRGRDIQERTDNPRHLIANAYVKRGEILSRNNHVLAEIVGDVGSYTRSYSYPPLSNSIGYVNQKFGIFGIEKAYDDYLSGMKGYPASNIWMNYLLYDQPPDGRSIRLTIDIKIQKKVDEIIQNFQGAAVVLDAENGNILALATNPYFNANSLEENWSSWNTSENSVFLNRASQGAYPVGGLLSPIFFLQQNIDTDGPFSSTITIDNEIQDKACRSKIIDSDSFQSAIKKGCLSALPYSINDQDLTDLVESPVFEYLINSPDIGLPTNPPIDTSKYIKILDLFSGSNQIRLSPLQVAASFAQISNEGFSINPKLVSSVNISSGQWVVIPSEETRPNANPLSTLQISEILTADSLPAWEISATNYDLNNTFNWFVIGTNDKTDATPLIISLVLENENRDLAIYIGEKMFREINQQYN
jgi:cell division protein FtsW (lipid II flippase)